MQHQLCDHHILRLMVKWQEGGINPDIPEHAQYLADVAANLSKHLSSVIDTIIEEDQTKVTLDYTIVCLTPEL